MLGEAMIGRARLGAAVGMHRRAGCSGSIERLAMGTRRFIRQITRGVPRPLTRQTDSLSLTPYIPVSHIYTRPAPLHNTHSLQYYLA